MHWTEYEREETLPPQYQCGDPDYEDRTKCGRCGETYQCQECGAPWDVERNECSDVLDHGVSRQRGLRRAMEMTYFNGNPYKGPTQDAPLDKWAHDECLPEDQFTVTMLIVNGTAHINPETGFTEWDKEPHRHQNWPWHWAPVWGSPKPCHYCGKPVD